MLAELVPVLRRGIGGRWYGRGAADCKGNILMHLVALRALGDQVPVNLKLIVEGSEEQGTGGLEDYVPTHADLLRADAILVCDTGNAEVGEPSSRPACCRWPAPSSRCPPAMSESRSGTSYRSPPRAADAGRHGRCRRRSVPSP